MLTDRGNDKFWKTLLLYNVLMARTSRLETFLQVGRSQRDRGGHTCPARLPRRAAVLFALGVLTSLAAACTNNSASPGVASVGSTPTTKAQANSAPASNSVSLARSLKYAQCMRSHGLRNFPDPDVQGGFDDIPSNASPG